jgi:hypothetical protein
VSKNREIYCVFFGRCLYVCYIVWKRGVLAVFWFIQLDSAIAGWVLKNSKIFFSQIFTCYFLGLLLSAKTKCGMLF